MKTKYYIIKDGRVVGYAYGLDTAYKVCFLQKAAFACIWQHLVQLDHEWFDQLYLTYVGELPDPPMVIEEMARELMPAIQAASFSFIRKPSNKALLKEMFNVRPQWHKQDIEALCTGSKWSSVKNSMSRLRGEGINIRYLQDGIYVRK